MTLRSVLLGGVAALLVGASADSAPNGVYMSIEGGATFLSDMSAKEPVSNNGASTTTYHPTFSFDTGWAVLATVGYEWQQWRFEGEAGYRHNKIDRIQFSHGPGTGGDDVNQLTLMANMLYDIPLGDRFSASVGGGVGFDRVKFEWPGFGPNGWSDDEWRFAWQGIAGLNYAISPECELFVDYRYLDADGPNYSTKPPGVWTYALRFEDVETQTVSAGIRLHFN